MSLSEYHVKFREGSFSAWAGDGATVRSLLADAVKYWRISAAGLTLCPLPLDVGSNNEPVSALALDIPLRDTDTFEFEICALAVPPTSSTLSGHPALSHLAKLTLVSFSSLFDTLIVGLVSTNPTSRLQRRQLDRFLAFLAQHLRRWVERAPNTALLRMQHFATQVGARSGILPYEFEVGTLSRQVLQQLWAAFRGSVFPLYGPATALQLATDRPLLFHISSNSSAIIAFASGDPILHLSFDVAATTCYLRRCIVRAALASAAAGATPSQQDAVMLISSMTSPAAARRRSQRMGGGLSPSSHRSGSSHFFGPTHRRPQTTGHTPHSPRSRLASISSNGTDATSPQAAASAVSGSLQSLPPVPVQDVWWMLWTVMFMASAEDLFAPTAMRDMTTAFNVPLTSARGNSSAGEGSQEPQSSDVPPPITRLDQLIAGATGLSGLWKTLRGVSRPSEDAAISSAPPPVRVHPAVPLPSAYRSQMNQLFGLVPVDITYRIVERTAFFVGDLMRAAQYGEASLHRLLEEHRYGEGLGFTAFVPPSSTLDGDVTVPNVAGSSDGGIDTAEDDELIADEDLLGNAFDSTASPSVGGDSWNSRRSSVQPRQPEGTASPPPLAGEHGWEDVQSAVEAFEHTPFQPLPDWEDMRPQASSPDRPPLRVATSEAMTPEQASPAVDQDSSRTRTPGVHTGVHRMSPPHTGGSAVYTPSPASGGVMIAHKSTTSCDTVIRRASPASSLSEHSPLNPSARGGRHVPLPHMATRSLDAGQHSANQTAPQECGHERTSTGDKQVSFAPDDEWNRGSDRPDSMASTGRPTPVFEADVTPPVHRYRSASGSMRLSVSVEADDMTTPPTSNKTTPLPGSGSESLLASTRAVHPPTGSRAYDYSIDGYTGLRQTSSSNSLSELAYIQRGESPPVPRPIDVTGRRGSLPAHSLDLALRTPAAKQTAFRNRSTSNIVHVDHYIEARSPAPSPHGSVEDASASAASPPQTVLLTFYDNPAVPVVGSFAAGDAVESSRSSRRYGAQRQVRLPTQSTRSLLLRATGFTLREVSRVYDVIHKAKQLRDKLEGNPITGADLLAASTPRDRDSFSMSDMQSDQSSMNTWSVGADLPQLGVDMTRENLIAQRTPSILRRLAAIRDVVRSTRAKLEATCERIYKIELSSRLAWLHHASKENPFGVSSPVTPTDTPGVTVDGDDDNGRASDESNMSDLDSLEGGGGVANIDVTDMFHTLTDSSIGTKLELERQGAAAADSGADTGRNSGVGSGGDGAAGPAGGSGSVSQEGASGLRTSVSRAEFAIARTYEVEAAVIEEALHWIRLRLPLVPATASSAQEQLDAFEAVQTVLEKTGFHSLMRHAVLTSPEDDGDLTCATSHHRRQARHRQSNSYDSHRGVSHVRTPTEDTNAEMNVDGEARGVLVSNFPGKQLIDFLRSASILRYVTGPAVFLLTLCPPSAIRLASTITLCTRTRCTIQSPIFTP